MNQRKCFTDSIIGQSKCYCQLSVLLCMFIIIVTLTTVCNCLTPYGYDSKKQINGHLTQTRTLTNTILNDGPHAEARTSSLGTQKFLSQTPSILYTAVVKGKVALPCDITPPTIDDSVVLILWYKDEQLAPIYTLDARRGNLEQARTLTNTILDGRAYFNLHNRPAFLQIDPIKLTDAGDYRCRVDFKKARTVNTVISLKVIVPPEEPRITDMDTNELKGLIGPFNEGDELKIICNTNGGKPRPSLTWWRDYSIIDDSFEYNEKDVTTNQLTLPSLARHHLLSIFTCQAINNNITVPSSTSITLDLNLKPTEVRITQLTPILVADREAMFECNTFGSRPKALLYWLFDGTRHNTPLNGELQTSTTLTITLKHAHNNALLTCVAENPKIANSAISDQLKLDIQYIPQLSLQLGTPTISLQTIQEGNDIYFDCHIDSNPRPNAPILWRFNGNILHPQQGIIQSNVSLVLQRVTRAQSGTYQCEASNQQGIALSNAIHLKIRYAPVCLTDYTLVYGVSLHESVQLECDVESNPPQVSFQWKFDSTTDLGTFNQINDTSSILSYAPHASQDYGIVECIAKNAIGLQQKSCKYHIIQAGPPQFPFMCQVLNQSDNALVILCTQNGNEHVPTNWSISSGTNDLHISNSNVNKGSSHSSYSSASSASASSSSSSSSSSPQSVFVYPPTYYICEVYNAGGNHLVTNVSLTATVPPSQLSTNSLLADSSSHLDNSINSIGSTSSSTPSLTPSSSSSSSIGNSFQLFVPNLMAATNFQLKLFAENSKGRSDQIWLKAQTLRPAERLVDANSSINDVSAVNILRGKPMVIALLIGAGVVTLIVIALGIIAVVRVRRSANGASLPQEPQDPPQAVATLFEDEEECMGCCDDDCCDEMLLTSTGTSTLNVSHQMQQQIHTNGNNSKGPPDIIPSFGYCGGMDNKNFITYAYPTDESGQYIVPQANDGIHYAELSFAGQPLGIHQTVMIHHQKQQHTSPHIPPSGVEYAKIEFTKTQRVNLIGGSPKFESTV